MALTTNKSNSKRDDAGEYVERRGNSPKGSPTASPALQLDLVLYDNPIMRP